MKLHVGAGREDRREGWTNLDIADWDGVDIVADITDHIPLEDDTVEEMLASHVIEHIADPLAAFQELWRVAKDGCTIEVHVPYGTSDLAWTDPTHVRPYFMGSWAPFGQPYHWRMEQGYTADWRLDKVLCLIRGDIPGVEKWTVTDAVERIKSQLNVVAEMRAYMTAVKPARPWAVGKTNFEIPLAVEIQASGSPG